MEYLKELSRRHEALKKRIHAFRIPLGPTGRRFMGLFYFSIPIFSWYFIMEYTDKVADRNLKNLKTEIPQTIDQKIAMDNQREALRKLLDKHNPNKVDK